MNDYRIYKLNLKEIMLLALASVLTGLSAGWLFYDTLFGIILSPGIFFAVKKPVELYLADRRRRKLRDQFRDVLYSFSSSFALGAHMEEAMELASYQNADIYGADSDMNAELVHMIKKMRDVAGSDVELWNDLAIRSGLEDIYDFAKVFSACRDAGGNLVQAVDRAAVLIVEKINIENEMRTLFSQKKTEGRMMAIMPIAMIVFLRLSSPGYLSLMYETILGKILMTLALIAMIYSIYMTEKITRIDI